MISIATCIVNYAVGGQSIFLNWCLQGTQYPLLVADEPRSAKSFHWGWFQAALPGFLNEFTPRSVLIVHNDSDLYSSTLFTLASLDKLMVPGSVIILDEYSVTTHEFRAFADYRSAFIRSAHPVAMTSDYAAQVAFVFDGRT